MINIAVLGYGTVGSGVVEVINTNHESINKRAGDEINIKYVLDLRDFPGDPVEKVLVHDYEVIVNDPEVDIVVEVMGGIEPAYTFVKRALLAGKSVSTSNKALVAKHGSELMEIAQEKNINFLFEASCGGGIPIIRALNSSLTADEIDEITGILNGTTNYMLYKMSTENCDFDTVLKEAQAKGYAEADPTADVEGAKAALEEAGYPNGEGLPTVQLSFYSDDNVKKIAEAIAEMWETNLGIQVEVTSADWAVFYDAVQAGDYDVAAMGWSADYVNPMSFLPLLYTDDVSNNVFYSNTDYDAVVDQIKVEKDPAKFAELVMQADEIASNEYPVLPLYYKSNSYLLKDYVQGVYMTSSSNIYFKNAQVLAH